MNFKAAAVARILLGLVFFVFGLNGFLHFYQAPMSPSAVAFFGGLAASGYLVPVLFGTQLVAGLALLAGRFVPLALAVLAPILVNIIGFHIFLAPPSALGVPILVLGLEIFLVWYYREAFRPMFRARVEMAHGPAQAVRRASVPAAAR